MSDDLDIRSGGAVAVDTASIAEAAHGFGALSLQVGDVESGLYRVTLDLEDLPRLAGIAEARTAAALTRTAADVVEGARELERSLRSAATIYEIVELRARAAAASAAGDDATALVLRASIARLAREDPGAALGALGAEAAWRLGAHAELGRQFVGALAVFGPGVLIGGMWGFAGFSAGVTGVGYGAVGRDARLTGRAEPVRLIPLASATRGSVGPAAPGPTAAPVSLAAAPMSLAAAASRMPSGDARVRVEKYTMPDGSRQFAVYVTGTRAMSAGGSEPFDMRSNLQLYGGERSSSYDAVVQALHASGAHSGDVVHAFGHSQGGMIVGRLALEGEFDTRTLVTFGSPMDADVGPETLSVSVRHADDPVAALAGGGHPDQVGAPGSFIAERVVDPAPALADIRLGSHHMTAYVETAQLLDETADPRMSPVRGVFDDLGQAATVQATEWGAERDDPAPRPRGSAPRLRTKNDAEDPVDQ